MSPNIFAHCLFRQSWVSAPRKSNYYAVRAFRSSPYLPQQGGETALASKDDASNQASNDAANMSEEPGAMSRRLAEMTDEMIEQGGCSAQKAVGESGFSEELKRRLEARILDSQFKSENPTAFAQLNMPVRRFNSTFQQGRLKAHYHTVPRRQRNSVYC